MDTEDIFSTQKLNSIVDTTFVGYTSVDEVSSSQDQQQNEFPGLDDEIHMQQSQAEERKRAFGDQSIPLAERYAHSFLKRFVMANSKPFKKPPQKQLTTEQIEMRESMKRAMQVQAEVDLTLFNPKSQFEHPKDETPTEVRDLCLRKGIVTASEVFSVMSQNTAKEDCDDFVFEGLTQIEMEEQSRYRRRTSSYSSSSSSIRNPKIVNSVAEAVVEDFCDIDDETLAVVEEQQILNTSLGNLSQVLQTSQRAEELFNSATSQKSSLDLDRTTIDLQALSSDEGDNDDNQWEANTEQLEQAFMNLPAYTQLLKTKSNDEDKDSDKFRLLTTYTQQLEQAFMILPTYTQEVFIRDAENEFKTQKTKNLEDEFVPEVPLLAACSKSLEKNSFKISSSKDNTEKFTGFSFVSEKSVAIKNAKKFEDKFKEEDLIIEKILGQLESPAPSGFGFASGKKVAVKEINRFKQIFEDEDQKFEKEIADKQNFLTPVAKKNFKIPANSSPLSAPRTANNSPISTMRVPKGRTILPKSSLALISTPEPAKPVSGFAMASGQSVTLKENSMRRFADSFDKRDRELQQELPENSTDTTPVKPPMKKIRLDFGNSPVVSSPFKMQNFLKGINQHSTPLVSRANKTTTDSQEVSSINELVATIDDSDEETESPRPKKMKIAKSILFSKLNKFDDSDENFDVLDSNEDLLTVPFDVKEKRRRALVAQRELLKEKAHYDRQPMAGTVYMMKSGGNRPKMSEYVGNIKPKNQNRHQVTLKNVSNYKFSMQNHVSESVWKFDIAVTVGDNVRLVMDENSKVGVEEIKWSFLASVGIDPELAKEAWVENAFKMIVLKLAWLENSFEKFDKFEALKPENVLLQMKYRYDREIDRHKRPAVRKIVELDDIPCRRMVLKVADILHIPGIGIELELTDGWYSIRTSIDAGLADAVDRKKIVIDSKLMISCAELTGCKGFDPLELPGDVKLKIHANSTRRTTWDHRMGFCPKISPIRVSLDSVLATGGVIGKMKLMVTHVYHLIYVDSNIGGKKEMRSEKQQRRIENRNSAVNFALYERIAYQVQQEELKELRERVNYLKKSTGRKKELSPSQLCDLLECDNNGDGDDLIEVQMTNSMKQKVQMVRDERSYEMKTKIQEKLGERDKNISQLLKFRVVDAVDPKQTGIVSWWSPSEDLIGTVKEGQVIEIINSVAGPCSKEIQVTAGKSSSIAIAKTQTSSDTFKKYFRQETRIDDIDGQFSPPQNEFDVAFIVVMIEQTDANKIQKVFVSDETQNILCLNFWSSLSDGAFDDTIFEGNLVFAKNLQWRQSRAADKIPQAFVNVDTTIFLTNPKKVSQKIRLEEIMQAIENADKFVEISKLKLTRGDTKNVSIHQAINKENQQSNGDKTDRKITPKNSQRPVFSRSLPSQSLQLQANKPRDQRNSIPVTRKARLGMFSSPVPRSSNNKQAPVNKSLKRSLNKPSF